MKNLAEKIIVVIGVVISVPLAIIGWAVVLMLALAYLVVRATVTAAGPLAIMYGAYALANKLIAFGWQGVLMVIGCIFIFFVAVVSSVVVASLINSFFELLEPERFS